MHLHCGDKRRQTEALKFTKLSNSATTKSTPSMTSQNDFQLIFIRSLAILFYAFLAFTFYFTVRVKKPDEGERSNWKPLGSDKKKCDKLLESCY